MLLELTVQAKGKGPRAAHTAAELSRIIDSCGLYHQAKNKSTILEGGWDQLMAVARKCHDAALRSNQKIVTVMRAVDGPDVAPCQQAPADCAAMKQLLEDDGDWLLL
jgi:uncharacterized protein YqgV (UPF0045/DUF77 family)